MFEHVHGIYKDKQKAIKKYKRILGQGHADDNKINWIKLDDIGEFSRIDALSRDPGIIRIKFKNPSRDSMYLTTVDESGGGGSYHQISHCHLGFSQPPGIEFALEFFDNEHARPEIPDDENCPHCVGIESNDNDKIPQCKQNFINELKINMSAEIDYLCGPDSICVSITKIKIK